MSEMDEIIPNQKKPQEQLEVQEPKLQQAESDEHTVDLNTPRQEQSSMPVGETIAGRYEVLGKLGFGGMSTVYKVRHVVLNKVLALKILHKATQESVLRFQQEAKASTMLEHPNIIRVHEFGSASNELVFMTMDYLEGTSLSEILKKEGAIAPARATKIFGQICEALAHAHGKGVIHRDIKPSNIMIVKDSDETEKAIVVDFGIAKIIGTSDGASTGEGANLTRTGDIFGTPSYMSPEQCEGRRIDAKSDIYSLACVMYEAITGKPPYQAESVYQIIHGHVSEPPPPFPESLQKTPIGRRLEALILKAMAKSPSDRHKYILELASELKALEYDNSGFFNDLLSIYRIIAGRFNATERRAVLNQWTMRAASVLAIVLALPLFSLPYQKNHLENEVERNEQIAKVCRRIFAENFEENTKKKNTNFLLGVPKPLESNLKTLGNLCVGDEYLDRYYDNTYKLTHIAGKSAAKIPELVDQNLANGGFSINAFGIFREALGETVFSWIHAYGAGSELRNKATQRMVNARHELKILTQVLYVCQAIALANLLFLFVSLVKCARERFQKRNRIGLPKQDS